METTRRKPMGPLPGRPGNFRKSPWFWRVLYTAFVAFALGIVLSMVHGAAGAVFVGVAIFFLGTSLAFAAMTSLRSREGEDEKLRESP